MRDGVGGRVACVLDITLPHRRRLSLPAPARRKKFHTNADASVSIVDDILQTTHSPTHCGHTMLLGKRKIGTCMVANSPMLMGKRTSPSQVQAIPTTTQATLTAPPETAEQRAEVRKRQKWLQEQQRASPGWMRGLCALIKRQSRIPDDHRTPVQTQPNPKKRKMVRKEMPGPEMLWAMKNVAQNSAEWMGYRGGSYGASGHGGLAGWTEYSSNVDEWHIDTGLQARRPIRLYKDQFPCDHGHYREDEAADVYTYVMGVQTQVTGMYLHTQAPWMHCSPDLLVEYPPGVSHNKYAVFDVLKGIVEIKCPIRRAYMQLKGELLRPTIPAHYLLQVLNQIDIMNVDWCDFVCHWRFNEADGSGPVAVAGTPGKFKVAETLVMRVYRNDKAAAEIVRIINEHVSAVERTHAAIDKGEIPVPPAANDHLNTFGETVVLPLKHVVFYTTLDNTELTSPLDAEGTLLGVMHADIRDYWEHQPVLVTMHDVESTEPTGKLLHAVPRPDPTRVRTDEKIISPVAL